MSYSMSMVLNKKESAIRSQEMFEFHRWFIITLYYEMRQKLLQDVTAILLQTATKVYCKMLQGFLSENATVVTKCNSYYKVQCLLQNASVQSH